MKHLVIVRHAKSVPYGYDEDFHRDLKKRGETDSVLVSKKLKELNFLPGLIISSPALRAKRTAKIFADTFGYASERIQIIEDLYEGVSTQEFVEILKELPDENKVVYVFGHNPTVYYLVNSLLDKFYDDMPTTSSVGIGFNVDSWSEVGLKSGKKLFHYTPKMFK